MFNNPLFVGAMYAFLYYKSSDELAFAFGISQFVYRANPFAWNLTIIYHSIICIGSGYMFIYTLNNAINQ
jgi:hypothetical protein